MPDNSRTFEVTETRSIAAAPAAVYEVFADYRVAHPQVLPPSFFKGLRIEQGGYGAGTIVLVEVRFGKPRILRGVVTEPEPGRLLVESYPEQNMVTSFRVVPAAANTSEVTISTVIPRRPGVSGWLEERVVRWLLRRAFVQELKLVAEYVARSV